MGFFVLFLWFLKYSLHQSSFPCFLLSTVHSFSPPLLGLWLHITNSAAIPALVIPFPLPQPCSGRSLHGLLQWLHDISLTGEPIHCKKHTGQKQDFPFSSAARSVPRDVSLHNLTKLHGQHQGDGCCRVGMPPARDANERFCR